MPQINIVGPNQEGGGGKVVVPNAKIEELQREKQENKAIFEAAAGAAQLTAGLVEEQRRKQAAVDTAAAEGEFRALVKQTRRDAQTRLTDEQARFFEDDDGFLKDAEGDFNSGVLALKRGKSAAAQARIDELVAFNAPTLMQDRAAEVLAAREQFNTDRSLGVVSTLLTDAAADGDVDAAIAAADLGATMDLGERGNELMRTLTNTAVTNMVGAQLSNPNTALDAAERILEGELGNAFDSETQRRLTLQAQTAVRNVWRSPESKYGDAALSLAAQSTPENPFALADLEADALEDLDFSRKFLSPIEAAAAQSQVDKVGALREVQERASAVTELIANDALPFTLNPNSQVDQLAAEQHFRNGQEEFDTMSASQVASFVVKASNQGIVAGGLQQWMASLNYGNPRDREIVNQMARLGAPQLVDTITATMNASVDVAKELEVAKGVLLESGRVAEAAALADIPTAKRFLWEQQMGRIAEEGNFRNEGVNTRDPFSVANFQARKIVKKRMKGANPATIDAYAAQVAAASLNVFAQNVGVGADEAMELAATQILATTKETVFSAGGIGTDAPDHHYPAAYQQLLSESRNGTLQNFGGKLEGNLHSYEVVGLDPLTGTPNAWQVKLRGDKGEIVPLTNDDGTPHVLTADPDRHAALELQAMRGNGESELFIERGVDYMAEVQKRQRRIDEFDPDGALTASALRKMDNPVFVATHAALPSAGRALAGMADELRTLANSPELVTLESDEFVALAARLQDNAFAFSREDVDAAKLLLQKHQDVEDIRLSRDLTPEERQESERRAAEAHTTRQVVRAQLVEAEKYLTTMEAVGSSAPQFTEEWSKRLQLIESFVENREQLGISVEGKSPAQIQKEALEWAKGGGLAFHLAGLGATVRVPRNLPTAIEPRPRRRDTVGVDQSNIREGLNLDGR